MTEIEKILKGLDPKSPHVFFIGGCGEFGMNFTAYIYEQKLYLVDAGLSFAPDHEIGIDSHIPDLEDLMEVFGSPEAYLITHGHEDHVGALPLINQRYPAPIYSGAWTLKILEDRMAKFRQPQESALSFEVKDFETTNHGPIEVTWIPMTHSLPGCYSLLIKFGDYKLFHSGDFKFDKNPPYEDPPNEKFLKSIAPVDALVVDSTNATKDGFCPSEADVYLPLLEVCEKAEALVLITGFASNFWRLKTILRVAKATGRKVCFAGASLFKTLDIASDLGAYDADPKLIIEDSRLRDYSRDEVIIVATGSQGEPKAGLRRILNEEHRSIQMRAGDTIVFSSRTIPGNEKSVAELISLCHKKELNVITSRTHPAIHVSGHAYRDDLRTLHDLVKPRFYMPVHGSHTHLIANCNLMEDSAVAIENGDLFRLSSNEVEKIAHLPPELLFVDSWSRRPLEYRDMRARHKIGDSGLVLITGQKTGKKFTLSSDIIGLALSDQEKTDFDNYLQRWPVDHMNGKTYSTEEMNDMLALQMRRYLSQMLVKKPVVIARVQVS